jgi:guanylate kinase
MMKKNLFVLIGRSCVGKTTTMLKTISLLKDLHECISFTTRPKRENEIDGVHYYFINDEEFNELIDSRIMIESIEYNGYKYGLSYKSFSDEMDNIAIVEPNGLDILLDKLKDRYNIVSIKIEEPIDIIRKRFSDRGGSKEENEKRIETDNELFKDIEYDYLINSDENKLKNVILETRLDNVINHLMNEYDLSLNSLASL